MFPNISCHSAMDIDLALSESLFAAILSVAKYLNLSKTSHGCSSKKMNEKFFFLLKIKDTFNITRHTSSEKWPKLPDCHHTIDRVYYKSAISVSGEKYHEKIPRWLGACRTAQIREPNRDVWQTVILITVKEWVPFLYFLAIYLFVFIYSFILRAPPIWSEMFGRIKFPEFSRFSLIFSRKSIFPGFPWAVRTLRVEITSFSK